MENFALLLLVVSNYIWYISYPPLSEFSGSAPESSAKNTFFPLPKITLGARDFSSAVSVSCQVFIVTHAKSLEVFSRGFAVRAFGLEPKISRPSEIPAARQKNLWCYLQVLSLSLTGELQI